jgi:hypothetical protein
MPPARARLPAGTDLHLGPLADNGGPTQNFALEAGSPAIAAADALSTTSATLHGTANPNGAQTVVTFEYGETSAYGLSSPADQSPLTSGGNATVSLTLTGLALNTTYHYRLTATNSEGTAASDDATFTTPKPHFTIWLPLIRK